ncbi:hypothetical protein [Qipengyuania zhejiangensis]|uniref:hypothetical protein n=1 Tax=Qipengyuania zhejiangensis TaxID=3077782 RepID=UPI002D7A3414|nr:hypothetical protein [Qipengyuania sp. Z2]
MTSETCTSPRRRREVFPRQLVECIRDARTALPHELAELSERIWREGLAHSLRARRRHAHDLAKVALCGVTGGSVCLAAQT